VLADLYVRLPGGYIAFCSASSTTCSNGWVDKECIRTRVHGMDQVKKEVINGRRTR
jgi:hypothetical protein